MQLYLFILFILFIPYLNELWQETGSFLSTYTFYNTLFIIFIVIDCTIFFSLNLELVFSSIFSYFVDPIYFYLAGMKGEDQSIYADNIIINLFYLFNKVAAIICYLMGVSVLLLTFIFYINTYINVLLFLLRIRTFEQLAYHNKWYTLSDLYKRLEEDAKKNESKK